jgi:hypothetical protein
MTTMGATDSELEQARSIYFSLGGLESDLGPRDDPNWYWRRAAKMAHAELQQLKALSKVTLPDDVETFVREVEARANKATPGPWETDGGQVVMTVDPVDDDADNDDGVDVCEVLHRGKGAGVFGNGTALFIARARTDVPRLVAIVREQGARIRTLETSTTGLVDENVALRERLAKLEALLMRVCGHWGPTASSPVCDCSGCTIIRDIAALLPDSAKNGGPK